jgi:hypothetical protein
MAALGELGLLARIFAGEPSFEVGSRLVGVVGAPLAVKSNRGIARVVRGLLVRPSLRLKLLCPAHVSIRVPSTVKCSVESSSRLRACAQDLGEQALG